MTEALLLTVAQVGSAIDQAALRPVFGHDESGKGWIWLDRSGTAPAIGSRESLPRTQVAPVSPSISPARALEQAALLPAWRLVQAAEVGLGTTVLVTHQLSPAREVLELCRLAGARWRALGDSPASGLTAEFAVPFADPAAAANRMPERPNAVIVLSPSSPAITLACALCRDMGIVVVPAGVPGAFDLDLYPDVHRRGLRVKLLSSLPDISGSWGPLEAISAAMAGEAGR